MLEGNSSQMIFYLLMQRIEKILTVSQTVLTTSVSNLEALKSPTSRTQSFHIANQLH